MASVRSWDAKPYGRESVRDRLESKESVIEVADAGNALVAVDTSSGELAFGRLTRDTGWALMSVRDATHTSGRVFTFAPITEVLE